MILLQTLWCFILPDEEEEFHLALDEIIDGVCRRIDRENEC